MGETITLTAADGHVLDAYRAEPEGDPKGAVVVIQEIFGVNVHIRDVADRLAAEGYLAIAPAIFDRFEKGVELGYSEDNVALGREYKTKANDNLDNVMADVRAAWEAASEAGKVGVIGYCWGGVVVWAAACRLDFDAASGYYGAGIVDLKDETPKCPTILHFGKYDGSIPMDDVDAISAAHPEVTVYVYDAGHGFNCDRRDSYNEESARTALKRTLGLFAGNLG
ncbi:MAG: carboxymethylenebutenolidase [Rhodospirillaceae bacterium]|jgi:carboxymethylenebutenolidase|nr:carboxymethylenebutenolidase [Rhodospirillaceae bacterium]|tara:strand:- start:907 stop:1578 length:672 start_codon:yes stop_codon:yes gene_type:complete